MATSLAKKLGRLALTIITLGTIVILFSLAVLLFLWIAPRSNPTWEDVILKDWLTNAVTIFSEALKQAMNFQVGVCAAMLSAIALERFAVLLPEIASCLAFRNDYSPWNAAMLFWKAAPRKGHVVGIRSWTVLGLGFVLVCVTCITQVFSIILVSDIGLGQVAGLPRVSNVPYGFVWTEPSQTSSNGQSKRWIVQVEEGRIVSTLGLAASPTSRLNLNLDSHWFKRGIVQIGDGGPGISPTTTSTAQINSAGTLLGGSSSTTGSALASTSASASVSLSGQSTATSPISPTGPATSETSTSSSQAPSSSSSSASESSSYDDYCAHGVAVSAGGFAPHTSNSIARCAPVIQRKTSWSQQAPFYPTFAEYHEDAPSYSSDGIDDTGRTLRAFVPFSDATARNSLQSFSGYTTVLDARVTCQTPQISNVSFIGDGWNEPIRFNGTVRALHATERLWNKTGFHNLQISNPNEAITHDVPAPFSCVIPSMTEEQQHPVRNISGAPRAEKADWYIALCQLANGGRNSQISGGLVSEFVNMSAEPDASTAMQQYGYNTGVAYLMINVTQAQDSYWARAFGNRSVDSAGNLIGQVSHGQWLDIPYGNVIAAPGMPNSGPQIVASSTLCYAAFDSANLNITMSSNANRTEPTEKVIAGSDTNLFDFSSIRRQLLGDENPASPGLTLQDRGLLDLDPRSSWLAKNNQEKPPSVSFLRDEANLAGGQGWGFDGNLSLALWDVGTSTPGNAWTPADPNHVYLFQEILKATDATGKGSPAHALQALLTVISGVAFYEQLPQFTASGPAEQSYFVAANVPLEYRGLTTVAITVLVHLSVMAVVMFIFVRECKLSMLGCEWQSLLQGTRGEVAELGLLETIDSMRDGEVEKLLAKGGRNGIRVGLARDKVDGRVHILAEGSPRVQEKRRASTGSERSSQSQGQRGERNWWDGWRWRQRVVELR